jgi:two-component system response regulator CssR
MSYTIYLVEDETNLNMLLSSYLTHEGWSVQSFTDGKSALESLTPPPHLWILDIMLPDIDGYHLIRKIKEITLEIPVIFISARDADLDRVIGLEMGSEDYLSKPFLPRELVIRVRNLLTRIYNTPAPDESKRIHIFPYTVDGIMRTVSHDNQMIDLTSKEFDLLYFFASNLGQPFSREQILQKIWGDDYFGSDRVVDDLIRRLRRKLPELKLETLYGYGYRMVKR